MSTEHLSVYIATYSNTDVYECTVGDAPIMRRCKDNWVNATQILKLCDFPKAKRTKILEKGVQQGLHEKVQGGYGRFQGTWIPLEDAQKLAQEYGISAEIVPVLYIDPNSQDVLIVRKAKVPGTTKVSTPLKRKYVRKTAAGTPKKMKFEDHLPPQAVFTQEYVAPRPADPIAPPLGNGNSNVNNHGNNQGNNHGNNHGNSSMPMPQMPMGSMGPVTMTHMPPQEYISNEHPPNMGFQRPANYPPFGVPELYPKAGYIAGTENSNHQQIMYQNQQKPPISQVSQLSQLAQLSNEPNWSQEENIRDSDTLVSSGDAKMALVRVPDEENSHVTQLLRFFSEDNAPIPYFLYNPPPEFNINEAIDDEGHLTLHWAASIGNLSLVHLLLAKGASPLVVSNFGLNPLSKSIAFNNCYDLKNFPHIANALEICLINTDINGRTPLHYLCQFAKVASKLPALAYYLDVIFAKLRVMSRNSGTGVDLIKNVIDHQDVNGDTCLHLAARARCTQLVKFFLAHGARDDLLDLNNQSAKALIMQLDLVVYNFDENRGDVNGTNKPFFGVPGQTPGQNPTQGQRPGSNPNLAPPMPTFQVTRTPSEPPTEKTVPHGLGTPIRGFSRLAETPDTQRTTIQDEEDDEERDHVSREHLKTLLQRQAGTVDDNKENIFVDDAAKTPGNFMSTPKHVFTPQQGQKPPGVLGVISEQAHEHFLASSPMQGHLPCPPPLDKNGRLLNVPVPQTLAPVSSANLAEIKLPIKDVSSMVNGMMHSLQTSYEEELSGLRAEQERVTAELQSKRAQDTGAVAKVTALLVKHGLKSPASLAEAAKVAGAENDKYIHELGSKETQLLCTLGKWHAYELASLVEEKENQITSYDNNSSDLANSERWKLSLQLCKAQQRRVHLASMLGGRIRDFAVNTKMNKYRKLISMSCGLKVEDIDGLLEGIAASLNESTS